MCAERAPQRRCARSRDEPSPSAHSRRLDAEECAALSVAEVAAGGGVALGPLPLQRQLHLQARPAEHPPSFLAGQPERRSRLIAADSASAVEEQLAWRGELPGRDHRIKGQVPARARVNREVHPCSEQLAVYAGSAQPATDRAGVSAGAVPPAGLAKTYPASQGEAQEQGPVAVW